MSTLSPKGRDLVRAGRRAFQPTDADRDRLLGALRAQLGDSALPPDVGSVATAAAVGRSIWPLVSAVVVGIGIIGGALFFALRSGAERDNPPVTNVAQTSATTQVSDPVAPPSAQLPTSPAATPPATDPPTPTATATHRPQDRLAAEVAILSRATRDLRAGHPAEALKALDEYRRKFPKGLLSEEQRAARAQALCALGRFDEANEKLAGLAPQSPLAVQAKQFCDARLAAR
jgi:type IV secretory pathway VirB10-like protein